MEFECENKHENVTVKAEIQFQFCHLTQSRANSDKQAFNHVVNLS